MVLLEDDVVAVLPGDVAVVVVAGVLPEWVEPATGAAPVVVTGGTVPDAAVAAVVVEAGEAVVAEVVVEVLGTAGVTGLVVDGPLAGAGKGIAAIAIS